MMMNQTPIPDALYTLTAYLDPTDDLYPTIAALPPHKLYAADRFLALIEHATEELYRLAPDCDWNTLIADATENARDLACDERSY